MNCKNLQSNLSAFVDGELREEERSAIEAHLATCPSCSAERDALLQLRASLQTWQATRMSPFAADRILEQVRSHADSPAARSGRPMPRWIPAFTALGVATALIVLFVRSRSTVDIRVPDHNQSQTKSPVVARQPDPVKQLRVERAPSDQGSGITRTGLLHNQLRKSTPPTPIRSHRRNRSAFVRRPREGNDQVRRQTPPRATDSMEPAPDLALFASAALAETDDSSTVTLIRNPKSEIRNDDASPRTESELMDLVTETW